MRTSTWPARPCSVSTIRSPRWATTARTWNSSSPRNSSTTAKVGEVGLDALDVAAQPEPVVDEAVVVGDEVLDGVDALRHPASRQLPGATGGAVLRRGGSRQLLEPGLRRRPVVLGEDLQAIAPVAPQGCHRDPRLHDVGVGADLVGREHDAGPRPHLPADPHAPTQRVRAGGDGRQERLPVALTPPDRAVVHTHEVVGDQRSKGVGIAGGDGLTAVGRDGDLGGERLALRLCVPAVEGLGRALARSSGSNSAAKARRPSSSNSATLSVSTPIRGKS